MRKYTTFLYELEDLKQFRLFDFDSTAGADFRKYFEEQFYDRYRFRQIGAETGDMFKSWVKSTFNRHLPRYSKLYASQNVISNPFINTMLTEQGRERAIERGKRFGTHDGESLTRDNNTGGNYSDSYGGSQSVGYSVEKSNASYNDKNKSFDKHTASNQNLFADTPQNQNGETTDSGVVWNEGYITTMDKALIHSENGNAGARYGTNNGSSENSNTGNVINTDVARSVTNNQRKTNTKEATNDYEVEIAASEDTDDKIKYGLTDATVSSVLIEWRETFINIDDMFLKEFSDHFIRVY